MRSKRRRDNNRAMVDGLPGQVREPLRLSFQWMSFGERRV
jgi:hypothetical protein